MYRSQSTEAEQGEFCTGHREPPSTTDNKQKPAGTPVGHGVPLTWSLTIRIDYDDADRLRRCG